MLRRSLGAVVKDVSGGKPLSQALSAHPAVFSKLLVAMAQVGENSGQLDTVLTQYALDIERQDEVRRKIRSASIYPLIVLAVAAVVLFFICFKVIPTFTEIFASFHLKLPWLTQLVMTFAGMVHDHAGALILGAILFFLIGDYFLETEPGLEFSAALRRTLPGFKALFGHAVNERFFRTLSLLLNSGVPLAQSLGILEQAFHEDPTFQTGIRTINESIVKGGRISAGMRSTGLFAESALCGIEAGEEAGRLPMALDNLARYHNERLNEMARDLGVIVEPVMILGVGAVIAVVLLSLFLPIMQLSTMRPM
jgi:type II secretory pathway component PulF